ncbi:MAG: two-component sensor histidine kinase [Marmoricola sp.]|nr:two-component sensor histidine kinase [Marmoricola sp.]
MKLVPRSLTSRLVVTAVALVAVVGILVAFSATLAMRSYLYDKRDGEVSSALNRVVDGPPFATGPSGPESTGRPLISAPGTLIVIDPADGTTAAVGRVAPRDNDRGSGRDRYEFANLSTDDVARLTKLTGTRGHTITVAGVSYRVMAASDSSGIHYVIGLPTDDIDSTLESMVTWFALLTLLGVVVAGGAGTLLVRRQLRPLNEVADAAREVVTQDLSTGETAITTRVPAELTDPETEVGQVGAALNTLLDHVDGALAARHRSEQQVRQFVADASHELRTPLSTIHGYAELSRRTPEDPEVLATALNKVETEADRMSALVEDLLLLARLDAGRPLVAEDVDLTMLLLEAVADARVLAPDHHWRLDLPDEPVSATGDDARLHQVVTNLLNNARNHTPSGTTVTVSVAAVPGGGARIDVHDDGPGLPADIAGAAFERFTRGDTSRTRASGGAGLGLSLVSAITAAHGGTASVISAPGSTTFTVELPA